MTNTAACSSAWSMAGGSTELAAKGAYPSPSSSLPPWRGCRPTPPTSAKQQLPNAWIACRHGTPSAWARPEHPIETLALFIRFLDHEHAVPEAHQDAARQGQGALRRQFVEQLGGICCAVRVWCGTWWKNCIQTGRMDGTQGARRLRRPFRSLFTAVSLDRRIGRCCCTAMGPLIARSALERPDVVEVMPEPGSVRFVDRPAFVGSPPMGVEAVRPDGERIIRLVAAHVGAEVHRGQPLLTAELPETGERFEGHLAARRRRGRPSRSASPPWRDPPRDYVGTGS